MDGVTVLSEYTVAKMSLLECILISVLSLMLIIYGIWLVVNTIRSTESKIGLVIFTIVLIAALVTNIVMAIFQANASCVEQKVTIDDSVSYTKFVEHYEVISQDGDIFTVRPLDKPENPCYSIDTSKRQYKINEGSKL